MVEQLSYSKINAERLMGNAEPPRRVARSGHVITVDISQDPKRIYAPAIVYGFSFRLKKWGCFSIEGFSEVVFDGGSSWNQLVMDPNLQALTEHLVAEHLRRTGKTLTAESLAEKLSAPLWSLSVLELGTDPDELENRLFKILEVAASWKTVLLLDEADIYLEKRITSDVTRNAIRAELKEEEPAAQNLVREMAVHELNGREIRNAIRNAHVWARAIKEPLSCRHINITATQVLASSLTILLEREP
ncbi:hypothetical protein R1flu_016531 [Riccia fluitans]|uniref:ATPase AAA-type core domain-containing protein n=1 Tax=Riccia fluitans TaxID=41844 RepID=A0ABD1YMG4_9MARC